FLTDNTAAANGMLALVRGAKSFVHVSSHLLVDDPFGRALKAELIRRAREGVKVRMLIDRISTEPLASDYGFVWMSRDTIRELRRAGVELLFHELMEPKHGSIPSRDPMARYRRNILLAD